MTKTLTEQWKNGELGFGYYYIDFGIGGVPMLFNGLEFYCERTQKPNAIKTILAPVPSYDEYKELTQRVGRLEFDNEVLDNELKELATKNDTLAMENGRLQERLADADKTIEIQKSQLKYALEVIGQIAKLSDDKVDAVQCASAIVVINEWEKGISPEK